MEWAKAKNLEILLLVIVNVVLFALNTLNGNEYILAGSAQRSIVTLLNNNNIVMGGTLPKDYSPMRNLQLKPAEIDMEKLKSSMFSAADAVNRKVEIGRVTFTSDYSELILENNSIKYSSSDGRTFLDEPLVQYDLESVRKYAQNIVNRTDYHFSNLTLDTVTEKNDAIRLTYYESYRGWKILDSYIKISVTDTLDISVEIVVYKPQSFVEFARAICSSDEAMLTLIPALKHKQSPIIEKVDIVYNIEPSKFETNTEIKSIPYYRVFITGVEKPYLINAYINRIKLEGEQYFNE